MASELHSRATIFDGLVVSNFNRRILEDMRAGGITAANCTCCIWEGFEATMLNVARWKRLIADNADLVTQVYDVADIEQAKAAARSASCWAGRTRAATATTWTRFRSSPSSASRSSS
jgi:membrane dipeptidase